MEGCPYCKKPWYIPSETEIRNKAIDDFAEKLKEKYDGEHWENYITIRKVVDKLAEQLKEE